MLKLHSGLPLLQDLIAHRCLVHTGLSVELSIGTDTRHMV